MEGDDQTGWALVRPEEPRGGHPFSIPPDTGRWKVNNRNWEMLLELRALSGTVAIPLCCGVGEGIASLSVAVKWVP